MKTRLLPTFPNYGWQLLMVLGIMQAVTPLQNHPVSADWVSVAFPEFLGRPAKTPWNEYPNGEKRRLDHKLGAVSNGLSIHDAGKVCNGYEQCNSVFCSACKESGFNLPCPRDLYITSHCGTGTPECHNNYKPAPLAANLTYSYAAGSITAGMLPLALPLISSDFISGLGGCQIHCYIIGTTANPYWIGNKWDFVFAYDASGHLDMNLEANPPLAAEWRTYIITTRPFYLNIEFECDNGFRQYKHQFNVFHECGFSSTDVYPNTDFVQTYDYCISLNDIYEPNYQFKDWITTEPRCPIGTRTYNKISPELKLNLEHIWTGTQANTIYMVELQGPYKFLKGSYNYDLRFEALGGHFHQTPMQTLNVICCPTSTNATYTIDYTQTIDLGSVHGFNFENITSYSDCPFETYEAVEVGTNTIKTDLANSANVHVTRQNERLEIQPLIPSWTLQNRTLMIIRPADPTLLQTYTFEILAYAEGGFIERIGLCTLIVKCIPDNIYIYPPPNFKNKVRYYKGTVGQTDSYLFDPFTTSHAYCGVVKYVLDDNDSDAFERIPAGLSWHVSCNSADNLCRNVVVQIDVARNITFWIKVFSRQNDPIRYFRVEIEVSCGIEEVFRSQTSYTKVFTLAAVGTVDHFVNLVSEGIAPIFTTSLVQCPFREYNTYYDELRTFPMLDETEVDLKFYQDPPNTGFSVEAAVPFFREFYLEAVSEGWQTNYIKMTICVCGLETIVGTDVTQDFVYDYNPGSAGVVIPFSYLNDLFTFNKAGSHDACNNLDLQLYEDAALTIPWVNDLANPTVHLLTNLDGTKYIQVFDGTKFREKSLYLKRITYGEIFTSVKLNFEVCGLEKLSLRDPNHIAYANFTQYSYIQIPSVQWIYAKNLSGNTTSDSRMCPLSQKWEILWIPPNSNSFYSYVNTDIAVRNYQTYDIDVSTRRWFTRIVYIHQLNVGNSIYIPVNVTVHPATQNLDYINKAPYFLDPIKNKFFLVSNKNYSRLVDENYFFLPIGHIEDDFLEPWSLRIKGGFYGEVNFTNSTGVVNKRDDQILNFNPETRNLTFNFSSFLQVVKYNGTIYMEAILKDIRGKQSITQFIVWFNTSYESDPIIPYIDGKLNAKITQISSYGIIQIKFSHPMVRYALENGTRTIPPPRNKNLDAYQTLNDTDDPYDPGNFGLPLNLAVPYNMTEMKNSMKNQSNSTLAPSNQSVNASQMNSTENSTENLTLNSTETETTDNGKRRLLPDGITLQDINSDTLQLWVEPYDNWPMDSRYHTLFNWTDFNFTWYALSFEDDLLKIQVRWNSANIIKHELRNDTMYVAFPNKTFWQSTNGFNLQDYSQLIAGPVSKQYANTDAEANLGNVSETIKELLKVTLGFVALVSLLSPKSLNYMLLMINTMQLIIHLPIYSVTFPSNAMIYLSNMIPIVMLDLLEGKSWYENMYRQCPVANSVDILSSSIPEKQREQINWLSYDSQNPLVNMGTISLLLFIYFVKMVFFLAILLPCKNSSKQSHFWVKGCYKSVKRQLFFTDLFTLLLETYLEMVVSIYLIWMWVDNNLCSQEVAFSKTMSIILFIMLYGFLPVSMMFALSQTKEQMDKNKFQVVWGSLWNGMKVKLKGQQIYNLIFVVRRMFYVLFAFNLAGYTGSQLILLQLMNLGFHMYLFYFLPRQVKWFNWYEMWNEMIFYAAVLHVLTFTDWVYDPVTVYNSGWSFIIVISLNMILNMIPVFYYLIRDSYRIFQKLKLRWFWDRGFDLAVNKSPTPFKVAQVRQSAKVNLMIKDDKPDKSNNKPFKAKYVDPSTLIWPTEAPKMFGVTNEEEIVNGKWVNKNKGLFKKPRLPPKEINIEEKPLNLKSNSKHYIPSLNLVKGKWTQVGGDALQLNKPNPLAFSHVDKGPATFGDRVKQAITETIGGVGSPEKSFKANEPQPQDDSDLENAGKPLAEMIKEQHELPEWNNDPENHLFERREVIMPDNFVPNEVIDSPKQSPKADDGIKKEIKNTPQTKAAGKDTIAAKEKPKNNFFTEVFEKLKGKTLQSKDSKADDKNKSKGALDPSKSKKRINQISSSSESESESSNDLNDRTNISESKPSPIQPKLKTQLENKDSDSQDDKDFVVLIDSPEAIQKKGKLEDDERLLRQDQELQRLRKQNKRQDLEENKFSYNQPPSGSNGSSKQDDVFMQLAGKLIAGQGTGDYDFENGGKNFTPRFHLNNKNGGGDSRQGSQFGSAAPSWNKAKEFGLDGPENRRNKDLYYNPFKTDDQSNRPAAIEKKVQGKLDKGIYDLIDYNPPVNDFDKKFGITDISSNFSKSQFNKSRR